jgi:oxygen-independent coproporphyrinogen-3 oxidase
VSDAADTFAVYVHWPFCAAKCPYCDFNSHVRHAGWDEQRFLNAYKAEITATRSRTGPRRVHSIFFGGGTPSLMQPTTTAAILEAIASAWTIEPGAEVTLEANPNSVEAARFNDFRAAGINRVSIGVQSLDPAQLAALGRIHSVDESLAAIDVARRAFDRFSFDLIYARPKQTLEAWRGELAAALNRAGDHLSLYQLTIEPQTPYEALHRAGKLALPDDDTARAFYDLTQDMTAARGLAAYEISNHAQPGAESRHNLVYWRYGFYAGIGPGAHGRLPVGGARMATMTERHPEAWRDAVLENGHAWTTDTPLEAEEQADEALLMGLRLLEGLPLARLAAQGFEIEAGAIDALVGHGMLTRASGDRLVATADGRMVLNAVVAALSKAMRPMLVLA